VKREHLSKKVAKKNLVEGGSSGERSVSKYSGFEEKEEELLKKKKYE